MKKGRDFILGFFMLQIIWWAAAGILQSRVLPGPFQVYRNFPILLQKGILFHICASLYRILAGLALSLGIGLPVGFFIARHPKAGQILGPLLYFSYPIPKTALLPAAMLLLGLGDGSRLVIMVLTMVFQVMVTARDAVRAISPVLYQVGRSGGRTEWHLMRHVTFPAILPELFTMLRINLGTSLAVLLIVEAYGTQAGMGYYILDSWSRISYNEMYGGIVIISLIGGLLFLIMDLIFQRVCRWK